MGQRQLYLATVVFQVGAGEAAAVSRQPLHLADALMDHPDVVTVRPEYGEQVWLYRVDVRAPTPADAMAGAEAPVEQLRRERGLQATVVDVTVMDEAQKRRFHHPFYERTGSVTASPPHPRR